MSAGLALAMLLCGAGTGQATGGTGAAPRIWVLPPAGQTQVRRLLTPATGGLPHGFKLHAARIERTVIRARYRADGRETELVLLLGHPEQSPREALRTNRFAIWRAAASGGKSVTAQALQRAVMRLVQKQEGGWQWKAVVARPTRKRERVGQSEATAVPGMASRRGPMTVPRAGRPVWYQEPTRRQQVMMLVFLAVLLLGLPLARFLVRRRRRADDPPPEK